LDEVVFLFDLVVGDVGDAGGLLCAEGGCEEEGGEEEAEDT
jgi:hypothetical protein